MCTVIPFYDSEKYAEFLMKIRIQRADSKIQETKEERCFNKKLFLIMTKYNVKNKYTQKWRELLVEVISAEQNPDKGSGEAMFNQILVDLGTFDFKRKHFLLDRKKKYLAK